MNPLTLFVWRIPLAARAPIELPALQRRFFNWAITSPARQTITIERVMAIGSKREPLSLQFFCPQKVVGHACAAVRLPRHIQGGFSELFFFGWPIGPLIAGAG
jgi:hypothetical protein